MLGFLAAYRRQNQLYSALQELGRIERTLFMLDWLESPELRWCCHAGLEQKRAAPLPRAGHLHLQAGSDRRPQRRGAAVSRLRSQPRHRRDRVLEHHLYRRRHRASAHDRKAAARRMARPYIAPQLGAHQPVRRFPVGPRRCNCSQASAAQSQPNTEPPLEPRMFSPRSALALFR